MRRHVERFIALVVLLPVTACLSAHPVSPYGREVIVRTPRESVRGELLAASPDSVWVFTAAGAPRGWAVADVTRVDLRINRLDGRRAFTQAAIVAGGTAVLLAGACVRVEDADCGGVFPVVAASFLVSGALFSWAAEYSSLERVAPPHVALLARYARWPQGLPPAALDSLGSAIVSAGKKRE